MFRKIILMLLMVLLNVDFFKVNGENHMIFDKSKFPKEFCEKSFDLINNFILKTKESDIEFGMYFDYKTGEILKVAKGENDKLEIKFEENEFLNKHVASIHNHPPNLLSAPSGQNFGMLSRDFEDYEIIVGHDELWILEAKGINKELMMELRLFSKITYDSLKRYYSRYSFKKRVEEIMEFNYGNQLISYIDKKNGILKVSKVRYYYDS